MLFRRKKPHNIEIVSDLKHKMENNLIRVLDGQFLDELTSELCDFTLEEQNAVLEATGVSPSIPSDFVPILSSSVTYIVACILFNDKEEVLMMQEAKKSCAGKWYLPAGRMERGETIVQAAEREVLEETSLRVRVTTLLAIESAGGSWFRFVVTGKVMGGELKTPACADSESLQAKWIDDLASLSLRATDILNIVDIARSHYRRNATDPGWHRDILPAQKPHHKNYLRLVIGIRKKTSGRVNILLSEKTAYHFPTVEIHPGRNIHSTLRKFMIELFGAELPAHRPHGVLSIEHKPNSVSITDGICITVLVVFKATLEEVSLIGKCTWHELSRELSDQMTFLVSSKNSSLPLHVVR